MAYIDNIIQFVKTQNALAIEIENDRQCFLHTSEGQKPANQKLSIQQLRGILGEVMPAEHHAAFKAGETVRFDYGHPEGDVQVDALLSGSTIRMRVTAPGGSLPEHGKAEAAPEDAPPQSPTQAATSTPHPPVAAPVDGQGVAPPPQGAAGQAPKRVEHVDELLRYLEYVEGSDIHLSAANPPLMRLFGQIMPIPHFTFDNPAHLKKLLFEIAPKRNREEWERDHDTDFSHHIPDVARYRCNYCMDRYGIRATFRLIPDEIVSAEKLGLPAHVLDLCFLSKGLVLVTGPTGSGKSTTLASLVDHVNRCRTDHIITIEDPIEFVHNNIGCLVNQREVHTHTSSFSRALRAALREDPDIVLVGEMRDLETVAIAIETAETGHLVFGTLHTTTAPSTVDRVIDQFPADQQDQIRVMLSESLKAVIAQTLCRTTDGRRIAAFEILLIDAAAANMIREGKTYQLHSVMQIGRTRGCITMTDSLLAHVKSGRIEPKEAYFKAVDKPSLMTLFEAEDIKFSPASI